MGHPDRGLLVVSAWADWTAEDAFLPVVAEAETLLSSLEFVEFD